MLPMTAFLGSVYVRDPAGAGTHAEQRYSSAAHLGALGADGGQVGQRAVDADDHAGMLELFRRGRLLAAACAGRCPYQGRAMQGPPTRTKVPSRPADRL
jgi:hypothetical protein